MITRYSLPAHFPWFNPNFWEAHMAQQSALKLAFWKMAIFVAKYHGETKENIHGSLLLCSSWLFFCNVLQSLNMFHGLWMFISYKLYPISNGNQTFWLQPEVLLISTSQTNVAADEVFNDLTAWPIPSASERASESWDVAGVRCQQCFMPLWWSSSSRYSTFCPREGSLVSWFSCPKRHLRSWKCWNRRFGWAARERRGVPMMGHAAKYDVQ